VAKTRVRCFNNAGGRGNAKQTEACWGVASRRPIVSAGAEGQPLRLPGRMKPPWMRKERKQKIMQRLSKVKWYRVNFGDIF
jgi:hypothetical protein